MIEELQPHKEGTQFSTVWKGPCEVNKVMGVNDSHGKPQMQPLGTSRINLAISQPDEPTGVSEAKQQRGQTSRN